MDSAAAAVIVLHRHLQNTKTKHLFLPPARPQTQTAASVFTSGPVDLNSLVFAAVVQAGLLRRGGLSRCVQVVHHLPRRDAHFHQVVPAHGRVGPLGQRQTLLHPHHQQVRDFSTNVITKPLMSKIYKVSQ